MELISNTEAALIDGGIRMSPLCIAAIAASVLDPILAIAAFAICTADNL